MRTFLFFNVVFHIHAYIFLAFRVVRMSDKCRRLALSFSGCGLLAGYHLGAWEGLCKHGGRMSPYNTKLIGCSGGALIAGAMASGVSPTDTASALQSIVDGVRACGTFGILRTDVLALVRAELERVLPQSAHDRCTGWLTVCVTAADGFPWRRPRPVLKDTWETRSAFIDSLLSSSYIPMVTSRVAPNSSSSRLREDGTTPYLMDGGLSGLNFPTHPTCQTTVRVSPFAGDLEISPAISSPWPPSPPQQHIHTPPRRILLPAGVLVDVSQSNATAALRAFVPNADIVEEQRADGYKDACSWLRSQLEPI
jgi:hypothetical protein